MGRHSYSTLKMNWQAGQLQTDTSNPNYRGLHDSSWLCLSLFKETQEEVINEWVSFTALINTATHTFTDISETPCLLVARIRYSEA